MSATSCADFTALPIDVCGNSVVEAVAGEDCDSIEDASLGDDLLCGPADGSAQACRYVCDGAQCPVGWTCEDDGICRAPSGLYEIDEDPILILSAEQLLLADVVQDERAELIARAEGDLRIFSIDDEGFERSSELSLFNARGQLSAVDLDEDEHADLLLPAATRFADATAPGLVHALRHGSERLQTVVVPQRSVDSLGGVDLDVAGGVVAVRPDVNSAAEVPVVVGERDGELVAFVPEPSCEQLHASVVATLGSLGGRSVLRPAARAATPDMLATIAVPLVGEPGVVLASVQRRCGPNECSVNLGGGTQCVSTVLLTQVVTFESDIVAPGCRFWDADGDSDKDLVCHLEGDQLAYAAFEGALIAPPTDFSASLQARALLPDNQPRACGSGHPILATADLNDDGFTDIITPHGIFVLDADGPHRVYARVRGDAWGEVVVGDFDGDGALEIAASVVEADANCKATQLEHLVPTLGSFSAAVIPNAPPPDRLRVGDLDGDGLSDVTVSAATNDSEVQIVTFFGDRKEVLEDHIEIGGFSQVDALVPIRSRLGTDLNEELIGDLVIISDAGEQWTVATGTTERSLLAPLPLDPTGGPPIGDSPTSVFGGVLVPRSSDDDDDVGPADVLALAEGHVWLYRDDDVHHGDNVLHLAGDAVPGPLASLRVDCSRWHVLNRGAEGAVMAGVDGIADNGGQPRCDIDGVSPSVVIATIANDADGPILISRTVALPNDVRRPTSIELFHFGPAGLTPDALVQVTVQSTPPRPALLLLSDVSSAASVPTSIVDLLPSEDIWAAAAVNADRDRDLEIAFVTSDGLGILDLAGHDDSAEPSVTIVPLTVPSTATIQLVAGALDEDDLTDLALLSGDALFLFPAVPVD